MRYKIKTKYLIVVAILAVSVLFVLSRLTNRHQSDSKLIENFKINRTDFSELLSQYKQDSSIDVLQENSSRSYESGHNFGYKNYQQKMKKLGLIEVFNGMNNKDIIWFVTSKTFSNGRKGYVYIVDPEYKKRIAFYTVASTKNQRAFPRDGDGSSDTFFVPIGEDWFIFYEVAGD